LSLPVNVCRRGAVYQWRRALPSKFPECLKSGLTRELRLSLRTHVLAVAKQRATRLSARGGALLPILEDMMQTADFTPSTIRAFVTRLLREALDRAAGFLGETA
jgi:hypothetical protein